VEFAVLVAFVGYIATMMVALGAVMAAWFVVIGPPPPAAHQPPRPAIGEIGRTTALATAPQPPQPAQSGTAQSETWGPAVVHRADDRAAATNADETRAAAEQAAAAEKAKQVKLARYRKRKEQEARQRQEQRTQEQDDQYGQSGRTYSQRYSTALGYDREGPRDRPPQPPPAFFLFGPPRY
jgi:hypothetical protein